MLLVSAKRSLKFLTEPGFRDAELVTVFGNGAAGYLVAFFHHLVYEFVIGERLMLVFVLYAFHQGLLEFACRDFLAFLILETF